MNGRHVAVSIRSVSKMFRLFDSPQQRLWEALHPFGKKYHSEFWALRDVSLDVPSGQTLGIIGRNGSGKSTLLQILCSVLRPTSGTVAVNGRVSALLELGAGFNPDFTGRENVLFYGTQSGLPAREMHRRLPEIEEFADIGDFLDRPVRTYSSGMFVRLAFAAAIHTDPDILVVDEALSVGDAKFQHKCFGKFNEFRRSGKTILFVTHDVHAIARHCDHAVLLDGGVVIADGAPGDVVNRYHELLFMGTERKQVACTAEPSADAPPSGPRSFPRTGFPQHSGLEQFLLESPASDQCMQRCGYNRNEYRYGDRRAEIVDYLLVADGSWGPQDVASGGDVDLYLKVRYHERIEHPVCGFAIKTKDQLLAYGDNTWFRRLPIAAVDPGDVLVVKFSFTMNLQGGDYFVDCGCAEFRGDQLVPLDRRYGLIHLTVRQDEPCDGLVALNMTCSEAARVRSGSGAPCYLKAG